MSWMGRFLVLVACLGSSAASAQSFHLERDFDLVRGPDGRPLRNVYWVSLPVHPVIADLAVASGSGDRCVGDPNGPTMGDGLITASDLICAWWSARADLRTAGIFTLAQIRTQDCTPMTLNASVSLGAVRFTGTDFPIDPTAGLQVLIAVRATDAYSPHNHAVIDGTGDPGFSKRLDWAPTCAAGQTTNCCGALAPRQHLLLTPYDTLYASSDEILCGLEGVDWQDQDGDGAPDACFDDANGNGRIDAGETPLGIWDGRHSMTVFRFLNSPVPNGPVARTVTNALGRSRVVGTKFQLVVGDAYLAQMGSNYQPVRWKPVVP